MESLHNWPVRLSYGAGTVAYWSKNVVCRLVVFVHGFRGYAVKTWMEFPSLLEEDATLGDCDLIYYGYDSPNYSVAVSGERLYRMLDWAGGDSGVLVDESLPPSAGRRGDGGSYWVIVVVAHSLGAVIARQALLLANERRRPWADRIRLLLFAPAHTGSDVVQMAATFLGVFKPLSPDMVKAGVELLWPVLKDLDVESETWKRLERDVEAAVPVGDGPHCLKAHAVLLGAEDRIVRPLRFGRDPSLVIIEGRDHVNICKPDRRYGDPLRALMEALR